MKAPLLSPIITEKSMAQAQNSIYTFKVDPALTKSAVKVLVEDLFKVSVRRVTTTRTPALGTLLRNRHLKVTPGGKVARVFVKKGETIPLFDLKESK